MLKLDLQVIKTARYWLDEQQPLWLCTVLSTFGSSPREPGSVMIARKDGSHKGSLSGGCVEESFIKQLSQGVFDKMGAVVRYGDGSFGDDDIKLPCGGILEVLVQKLPPNSASREHLQRYEDILLGNCPFYRIIDIQNFSHTFEIAETSSERVVRCSENNSVKIRVGPVSRLIIAGISPVTHYTAQFASSIGFEVIVCDARRDECDDFTIAGVRCVNQFPADFIMLPDSVHRQTAVVALTHDPRIDDLALMEAINTDAFYIGVMGSLRTSKSRAERLKRSGGFEASDITRLHMPIGLNLGSKTPAEIGLAVVSDILRVQRGRAKTEL